MVECFFSDGNYYWNSGMFMLKVFMYMEELYCYVLEIVCYVEFVFEFVECDNDFVCFDVDVFVVCLNVLIDYVVMEKIECVVVVVVVDFGWNDIGLWSVFVDIVEVDE